MTVAGSGKTGIWEKYLKSQVEQTIKDVDKLIYLTNM